MKDLLPRGWWDQVLDGQPYLIRIGDTDFHTLAQFRAAIYREGEEREVLVATHKNGTGSLIVQAYGTPHLPAARPVLRGQDEARQPPNPQPLRSRACDCGRGLSIVHPSSCAQWGGPRIMTAALKSLFAAHAERKYQRQSLVQISAGEDFDEELLCNCGKPNGQHPPECGIWDQVFVAHDPLLDTKKGPETND